MTCPPARAGALVADSALCERTAIPSLAANTVQARASAVGGVRAREATLRQCSAGRVEGETEGRAATARGLLLGLALAGLRGRFARAARQGPRSP